MSDVKRIAVVGTLADTIIGFRGELIRELVQAGHSVYAFATDYNNDNKELVKALGAEPVAYSLSRFSLNPFSELGSLWQLYRLFKLLRIELSFCYFVKPVIYGTLAAALAGVPQRVAKIEGLGRAFTIPEKGDHWRRKLLEKIQLCLLKISLPYAHLLIVLNSADQSDLITKHKIRTGKVALVNGIGVNLELFTTEENVKKNNKMSFVFVGRLLEEKGIRYFLQAARELKPLYPQAEFLVLGEPDGKHGVSQTELKQLVKQGIVQHPGRVADVIPYLHACHVFVLPSYYREGVPRSTQEAMAAGLAIITTDMPGCRDTVQHGENGLLVPPHQQQALNQAMEFMLQQPQRAAAMGLCSKQIAASKFDVKQINKKIIELLGLN